MAGTPFKILSLDGGGIRGIMSAAFLEELEKEHTPLVNYFDMVAGTSTGSIIALALAVGKPMAEIVKLYRDRGAGIFTKRLLTGPKSAFGSKYINDVLLAELENQFGDRKLEDAQCMVCIPAADVVAGVPKVFKTRNLLADSTSDILIRDASAASSAAPLYFPTFDIKDAGTYVDGGVWANNPALVAISEAIRIGIDVKDIQVLSVSTGAAIFQMPKGSTSSGLLSWGNSLIDLVFQTQSQGVNILAKNICGGKYCRIAWELAKENTKLDDVDKIASLEWWGRSKIEQLGEEKEWLQKFFSSVATERKKWLVRR